MKKLATLALAIVMSCTLVACSSPEPEVTATPETNVLLGKYFGGRLEFSETLWTHGTNVIKFSPSGVFELVHAPGPDTRKKYYGTYILEDRKLSMSIGSDTIACVIDDTGDHIYFGEYTLSGGEAKKYSNETIELFD